MHERKKKERRGPTMKMLPGAAIMLLVTAFLAGCGERIQPGQAEVARPGVSGVTVTKIAPVRVDALYETTGTVKAKTTSTLASRIFGTVTRVNVKEGDAVHAGDILLTIDDRDARQRLSAAESGYSEAKKAREAAQKQSDLAHITSVRYGNLYREKVVTRQEFDQIETQKNVARLEFERASLAVERAGALRDEARVHLGFAGIRAPFSGIVTAKRVEQGAMATPGMPLMTVEDTSRFKIEANVDERLSPKLKAGSPIRVRFDATGKAATGQITKVVPAVDPATRTFLVEASLKGESLKSGLYGKVLIPEGTRDALLVPRTAVVEKGRLTGVYAVDDKGVISYRLIRTGETFGKEVEVLSGLTAGDGIITGGVDRAVDGGIVTKDR